MKGFYIREFVGFELEKQLEEEFPGFHMNNAKKRRGTYGKKKTNGKFQKKNDPKKNQ